MGLNVDVLGSKELFGSSNSQQLSGIHIFTTAIPPLSRITFRVFVGQDRSLSFHNCSTRKILRSDQLDIFKLTDAFRFDGVKNLGIDFF
jgi:hypothetical protein